MSLARRTNGAMTRKPQNSRRPLAGASVPAGTLAPASGLREFCGLRVIAPLVLRARDIGACAAVDASGLCEALRQAAEERQHGCGGDLRSGHETQHAVCAE